MDFTINAGDLSGVDDQVACEDTAVFFFSAIPARMAI